jgi:hypothetical protein
MAKQINRHIKLAGTIDDISFYKSQDGFLARAKGGVSADRIKSDPKFENTRNNGAEFGIGGKASLLFREAFKPEIKKAADNRVASRITQLMVRILKTDPVNDYGKRQVYMGNMALLDEFEFNNVVPFRQALGLPLVAGIDRVTGQATVQVPAHVPKTDIAAPDGTTHYSFFAAAAAMDFEGNLSEVVRQSTAPQPWDTTPALAATQTLALSANSTLPLFLIVGIEFTILINGKVYPQSKGQSALKVAAVNMPAAGGI